VYRVTNMNKYSLAAIAFIAGRYIGRKDEEGRGKPSVLDFAASMTPQPNPNAEIPYVLPSLLRWPKWLRPPPTQGGPPRSGSEGSPLV
jgi:hypothetical protein